MRPKVILGIIVIVAGIILGSVNFVRSNVEYGDFLTAQKTGKLIQVKGSWVKDKESRFDADRAQFVFYMVDDNGEQMKVVLDGAKPNNFELATNVVARGKVELIGQCGAHEVLVIVRHRLDQVAQKRLARPAIR